MPTSIVAGGAGFMGSHICDRLLELGHDVYVFDDLSGGFRENAPKEAIFFSGTITNKDHVEMLFRLAEPDYIFHLAAYAAEGLSPFIRCYNYENNLIGSVNLINAAVNHRIKRFIFTSSIAVYGSGQAPFTETMVPQPEDPYGIAKWAVEQDLKSASEQFGLDYTIFRPHNVYGERQNIGDRYRNVVGIFMNQILRGEKMTVFGDGEQVRAFTYIDDVSGLIAESINAPVSGMTFNLGSDHPYTVNELAVIVAHHMGVTPDIHFLPPRRETKIAFSSHARAEKVFGKRVTTGIDHGIGRMAKWAKEHGARVTKPFAEIEIERGLPEGWR